MLHDTHVEPWNNWAKFTYSSDQDTGSSSVVVNFYFAWQNKSDYLAVINCSTDLMLNGIIEATADPGWLFPGSAWLELRAMLTVFVGSTAITWQGSQQKQMGSVYTEAGWSGFGSPGTIEAENVFGTYALSCSDIQVQPNQIVVFEVACSADWVDRRRRFHRPGLRLRSRRLPGHVPGFAGRSLDDATGPHRDGAGAIGPKRSAQAGCNGACSLVSLTITPPRSPMVVRAVALREHVRQRPCVVRGKPEAEEMAAALWFRPVNEACAIVQQVWLWTSCTSPGWNSIVIFSAGSSARLSKRSSASTCTGVRRGASGKRWAELMYWRW